MSKLLYVVLVLLALSACSKATSEERAAEAAKAYYDCLVKDSPVDFLEGKAGVDSLPTDFCEQLLAVHQKYIADVERKHGGIREVRISPNVGRCDSILQLTYAFLLLCYVDSTQEEIMVPMVERGGQWLMK